MKNWKTTLSGIASIIAGIAMYVNDPLKINEAIGLLVVGFGLVFAKDASSKQSLLDETEAIGQPFPKRPR